MLLVKTKPENREYGAKPDAKHLIGTLGERSLHSELKKWYAQPGDQLEKEVDGFHIDIVRGSLLIEMQTTNFSSIKSKLNKLAEKHPVRPVSYTHLTLPTTPYV